MYAAAAVTRKNGYARRTSKSSEAVQNRIHKKSRLQVILASRRDFFKYCFRSIGKTEFLHQHIDIDRLDNKNNDVAHHKGKDKALDKNGSEGGLCGGHSLYFAVQSGNFAV